jgi:hypothetical protein
VRIRVRLHSRYERRLADAAVAGRPATVRLTVRRFFCRNDACTVGTFFEQVRGLTVPNARRTPSSTAQLTQIAFAFSRRRVERSSGGGLLRRRSTQYLARSGSSGDALPGGGSVVVRVVGPFVVEVAVVDGDSLDSGVQECLLVGGVFDG